MFPVLKNADWSSVRKKREVRASDKLRARGLEESRDVGMVDWPFASFDADNTEFENL